MAKCGMWLIQAWSTCCRVTVLDFVSAVGFENGSDVTNIVIIEALCRVG